MNTTETVTHTPGPWSVRDTSAGQSLISSDATGKTVAVAYDPADGPVLAAVPELLAALRSFVGYGFCRQANTAERKALAEQFAVMAQAYAPLLERLGVGVGQVSSVEFDEVNGCPEWGPTAHNPNIGRTP